MNGGSHPGASARFFEPGPRKKYLSSGFEASRPLDGFLPESLFSYSTVEAMNDLLPFICIRAVSFHINYLGRDYDGLPSSAAT
jgi:hypothetical protein